MARAKLTRQERSWVLYDVGNSAFVLLATALIPVYFASIAEEGSSVVVAWGYAETVASLILCLESVFAAVGGWLLLGQVLSPRELAGCAVMLVACVLAQLPEKHTAKA